MKHAFLRNVLLAVLTVGACTLHAVALPPGWVDFGTLAPAPGGGEFVEINVRSNLIGIVARLAEKADPGVAEILRGLQAVRVNVIGMTDDNRTDLQERVRGVGKSLDAAGWERPVTVQKAGQEVGVFLKVRPDGGVEGLAVTVLEGGRQAVLVNIVGNIRPEKISEVAERLNIEPLKKIGETLKKQ